MSPNEQNMNEQTQVISPLANEKTYGERWYSRVFDWGLNYWTNLLASAGFSQWAEHATRPIKLPFVMKEAASPRQMQQDIAAWVREKDPLMQRFAKKMQAEKPAAEAAAAVFDRSMARARSITLLMPGFLVVIPTVWLGAKIKPWLVEKLNRSHYGDEAMNDPSLKARHQAIEAEARPTLLGTVMARLGTVLAVQAVAQSVGSQNNLINKLGVKTGNESLKKFGVDSFTEHVGASLGGALPVGMRNRFNGFARRHGLDHSEHQVTELGRFGLYTSASEDLGRFIAADTFYTAVTAVTIHPLVQWLPRLPLIGRFMSFKPKVAANSAVFEGEKIKVPANRYADSAVEEGAPLAANDPVALDVARTEPAANDAKETPHPHVHQVQDRSMLDAPPEQKRA